MTASADAVRAIGAAAILGVMLALAAPAASSATQQAASGYFWHPELAPAGPLVIVISLDEQQLYAYRNGVAIGVSSISSGKPGYETPTGVYTILQKKREHYSNLYDDAPMPYMQRLTWDGVALHAGALPGRAASHGCVRLPPAFASRLYGATRRGDVVVVADARVAPATVVHPSAVAPIDLAGQPVLLLGDSSNAFPMQDADDTDAPVSIVVSTADGIAYVLRNGRLVAHAPVTLASDAPVRGMLLYVMGAASDDVAKTPAEHRWTGYRILGAGPVPDPERMARQIRLPQAFGRGLRAMLRPGATVLVTDLPGYGRAPDPHYGALLQSGSVDTDHRPAH
ncbi:L,D-transpeptidase family protein [Oleiagrimonas soli]|uniref:L,D-TPase catalytic domain-containing protein n=1 Tax=Oleiagrimonas soli TaxID=1543381 RepID=A0A099D1K6_9GAMM|nr:L,D-transpeptidase family protein [Oleiagrimonas soli]KGI79200.1 hypothetical protein LF63_0100745 [Oleiagrimonas soli]MBB6184745.1 hypothetical protein [Oleiagrimonas soli]